MSHRKLAPDIPSCLRTQRKSMDTVVHIKYKDYVYGRCYYRSTWKNKEYLRSKDKAKKWYDVSRLILHMSKYKKWRYTVQYVKPTHIISSNHKRLWIIHQQIFTCFVLWCVPLCSQKPAFLPMSFRVTSQALGQHGTTKTWSSNYNDTQQNKTMCIFHGKNCTKLM